MLGNANGAAKSASAMSSPLAVGSAAVAAIAIVLYQTWFMPYFQPFFTGRVGLARFVFYAIYGSLTLTSAAAFVASRDIRRKVLPFAAVAVVMVAITGLHPIGIVTRAYIVAVIMSGALLVLLLAARSAAVLEVAAAMTALNAVLCFVELLFRDGFSSTAGRVSGLAMNPNDAAAAILLGAAATYRAVPRRWQLSFFVLIGTTIVLTMSRSTILAAAAAAAIPFLVERRQARERRVRFDFRSLRPGIRPAALLAVGLVLWVGLAALTNDRFRSGVQLTVGDSLGFAGAISQAEEAVAADQAEALRQAHEASGPNAARIAALGARLVAEGRRSSISARVLFLQRALLVFRNNGFWGMGLEEAHPLAPHNTFVLFALAFGYLGCLIPLALVAVVLGAARDARDLPLAVAVVGIMATSHDLLLMPSLFVPIAIGIAGMLGREAISTDDARVRRSATVSSVATVLLFAMGCVTIVLTVPTLTVDRISPETVTSYRGVYLTTLSPPLFPGVFGPVAGGTPWNPELSLTDDGQPLTRVRWRASANPAVAPGQFTVVDNVVVFAPADGSDPRSDGRDRQVGIRRRVSFLFYAVLATLAGAAVALVVTVGRRGRIVPVPALSHGASR